jgi:hypothetical protein
MAETIAGLVAEWDECGAHGRRCGPWRGGRLDLRLVRPPPLEVLGTANDLEDDLR